MDASVSFDPIVERYEKTRGGVRRGRVMADAVEPHLVTDGPLAEIGVGTEVVAGALCSRGHHVVGVDLAPAMLARAAVRLPGRVTVGDATCLPVRTSSVALAYLVWVLHVVHDPAAVIREAARIVAPDGRVVIVPAIDDHDASDLLGEAQSPLAVLRPHRPMVADIEGWMNKAQLTNVAVHTSYDESVQSPAAAADEIEQRVWSSVWNVDDDTWQWVVAPVIDALRALPDPTTPRRRRHSIHVMVGQK